MSEEARDCCVYMFLGPDGIPVYVGAGDREQRQKSHTKNSHNQQLNQLMQAADGDLQFVVVRDNLGKEEARRIEKQLIKTIGRRDLGTGPLVNLNSGGDGAPRASAETRQKMRLAKIGKKQDPELARRRAQASGAARRGKPFPKMREIRLAEFSAPATNPRTALSGIWITDGEHNRRIAPDTPVPDGWYRGRSGNFSDKIRKTLQAYYADLTPEQRREVTAAARASHE